MVQVPSLDDDVRGLAHLPEALKVSRNHLSLSSRYLCANGTASEASHLAMHSLVHKCGVDGSMESGGNVDCGAGAWLRRAELVHRNFVDVEHSAS